MVDFADVIKHLVDGLYPDAERILLVMDNLHTHSPGSLYEVFEPAEAKRLAGKLEEISGCADEGAAVDV
jgi:hypothetical protein